jgi:hypothetical protein
MGNEISLIGKRWEVATISDRPLTIGATDPLARPIRPIEIFRYKRPESSPANPLHSARPWLRSFAHGCGQNRAESGKSKLARILQL